MFMGVPGTRLLLGAALAGACLAAAPVRAEIEIGTANYEANVQVTHDQNGDGVYNPTEDQRFARPRVTSADLPIDESWPVSLGPSTASANVTITSSLQGGTLRVTSTGSCAAAHQSGPIEGANSRVSFQVPFSVTEPAQYTVTGTVAASEGVWVIAAGYLAENESVIFDYTETIAPDTNYVFDVDCWAFGAEGLGTFSGSWNLEWTVTLLQPRRLPVFIIPGIGATYASDETNDLPWLIQRGVGPSMLQIDPLARTYHDLIQTLENVGYQQGKDLFVVNYDWRLPPGPDDGNIDGTISGLTAAEISAQVYRYGVDYFGAALRQAAEQWEIDHPGDLLDGVDVIVHSTGGLVARTYIQSAAYGGIYSGTKELPKINNLVMIGVPNRGASKAWNPLHDNWVVDPAFEFVLAKIVNRAYRKVLNGAVIGGPDRNISLASLTPPDCVDLPTVCFVNQYIPTARSLLATYDFIDFGAGFTNVNTNPAARNSLLLDLNAGLDLNLTGDPNSFADLVLTKPTIIFGTNADEPLAPIPGLPSGTPTAVTERLGPDGGPLGFLSIASFEDVGPRDAAGGETWFDDALVPVSGDGTVPLESAKNQFVGDDRVELMPFTKGGNTQQSVGHTDLPYNTDVQQAILDLLEVGCPAPCDKISLGLSTAAPSAIKCAVFGCTNFMLDPVEGFIVDNQGRRLGYSTATGPVTEIPESVWYGNSDGMGWVFGPVEQPLTLELIGLGGPYYATVSVLAPTGYSGVVDEGVLGVGEQRVVPVLPVGNISLTVNKTGNGIGTVTSDLGGIDCGATCTTFYISGTVVTLAATADTGGSVFIGWNGGGCAGTGTCVVTVTEATLVDANFTDDTPPHSTQTFSPALLDVGSVVINGSAAAGISIGNIGSTTLNLVSLSITGTNPADFSFQDHGCAGQGPCNPNPSSIAVSGNPELFSIRCSPGGLGLRTAVLNVASDDPASPRTAILRCTGAQPVEGVFADGFESE